jgi:hypothetical protein
MQRAALLRRTGTVTDAVLCYGPGSAAHHAAKSGALRCVRGREARKTRSSLNRLFSVLVNLLATNPA